MDLSQLLVSLIRDALRDPELLMAIRRRCVPCAVRGWSIMRFVNNFLYGNPYMPSHNTSNTDAVRDERWNPSLSFISFQ
jgi:hypothetical protein